MGSEISVEQDLALAKFDAAKQEEIRAKYADMIAAGKTHDEAVAALQIITVYYWGMFGRAGSIFRMLEHTKAPYVHKSDMSELAGVCSAFGSSANDTFAPPVVQDGDVIVSQSSACCMYVGEKCGLAEDVIHYKAVQYMADIVDIFEIGVAGSKGKGGAALKAFLEGDRFKCILSNLERGVKGPFFFGDKPTYVDFFLAAHMDWSDATIFHRLKADKGLDAFAGFEKLNGVVNGIRELDSYKNYEGALKTADTKYGLTDADVAAYV